MSGIRYIKRYGERRLQAKFDKPDATFGYIEVIGGPAPYLWIGDDNHGCRATITGKRTLGKLAKAILEELA